MARAGYRIDGKGASTWLKVSVLRGSMCKNWSGRLVVKGVLDPGDARRAADVGVDGVVVSNHGGRQLDSVPSTAVALAGVVDAIGDQVEVLVDGGVRTGLDVVKMIALGARAVLIGRAWAWAVAADGEAGVRHVLRADIDTALGLTAGRRSPRSMPWCSTTRARRRRSHPR
jgi:L-lactate dehydrogenase (cytochrome)